MLFGSIVMFVICFVVWLACGIISAFIASSRKQTAFGFFILGLLFGPFGILITLLGAPKTFPSKEDLEKQPFLKPSYIITLACINVFIASVCIIVFFCLTCYIIPSFVVLFEGMSLQLPLLTQLMMSFAKVFQNFLLQLFLVVLWVIVVITYFRLVRFLGIKRGLREALEIQFYISFLNIAFFFFVLLITCISIFLPLYQARGIMG